MLATIQRAGRGHPSTPKILFSPSLEGYVNLFTTRTRQTPEFIATLPPATAWYDKLVRSRNMVIAGPSKYFPRYINSLIIGFGSTFLAVVLGTVAAYAFSRFKVPLKDDLLFFILSTRMMPPIAVAIPIYLMYRQIGLIDTRIGMILLYTAVNLSLSVWLLKGFMDEIPREYEEAAMIDGYSRLQAFWKVVLPQASTGIAATTCAGRKWPRSACPAREPRRTPVVPVSCRLLESDQTRPDSSDECACRIQSRPE